MPKIRLCGEKSQIAPSRMLCWGQGKGRIRGDGSKPLLRKTQLATHKSHPDLSEWIERRLAANAEVATILGSIPASSDTVESVFIWGAADETVLNKVPLHQKIPLLKSNSKWEVWRNYRTHLGDFAVFLLCSARRDFVSVHKILGEKKFVLICAWHKNYPLILHKIFSLELQTRVKQN